MTPTIHINPTEARKNFYKLIQQVSAGELRVVIQNKNTNKKVVMEPQENPNLSVEEGLKIVEETYGAIKTGGYKENEFELARETFIKEYKTKNDSR